MALSAYEQHVVDELEAELWAEDPSWAQRFEALAGRARGTVGRRATLAACFVVGVVLLLAGRQAWLTVKVSFLSGLSASVVSTALTVGGCVLAAVSALVAGAVLVDGRQHRRR